MSKKILVTGACGFIGTNLVQALRKRGPEDYIVGIDNLWTGVARDITIFALERLITGSIEHLGYTNESFDEVWHLASPASPPKYQSDPHRTVKANVLGLFRCLELLKPGGRIFYTSSSEVYGDPIVSPQPENYKGQVSFTGPRACYDESKRLCETILYDAHRHDNVNFVAVRYFNVYGPYTLPDDGRAMSNFITRALQGQTIEVYGDGQQTRCFTYINDVIDASLRLMDSGLVGSYNVGSTQETTLREVADRVSWEVAKYTNRPGVSIRHVASVVDDPRQRLPDMQKTQQAIGWMATTPYYEGMRRTIQYFVEQGIGVTK